MAERMTKEESAELDAKVLAKVAAGAHPHDVEGPLDKYFANKVEASVARLRRAGKIAYDHGAKAWRIGRPEAEKPARGPGRSAKPAAKPKARVGLRKAQGQSKYGTAPRPKFKSATRAKKGGAK